MLAREQCCINGLKQEGEMDFDFSNRGKKREMDFDFPNREGKEG